MLGIDATPSVKNNWGIDLLTNPRKNLFSQNYGVLIYFSKI